MPSETALIAAIDSYAETSFGSDADGSELSNQRALALDSYAGKIIDEAPEGTSEVVDWTSFETVQWIMPSLMRIFAGGDNIVEFDPVGPEDEEVAEQESDYLNYLVTQKNDWDLTVRTWCQDALITKNAYCMAFMEEKLVPETERYEGQTQEQVALLLEDDVEVVGQKQYDDPEDEGQVVSPITGQPVQAEEELIQALALYQEAGIEPQIQYRQLFDIDIKKVGVSKNLQFKVLPPERIKVGSDTPSFQIDDDCNYFEYVELTTISDVRKMGFNVKDDISDDAYGDTDEDSSRSENLEITVDTDLDGSMRQVMFRTIWIRHDYDEDGIAELQRVLMIGREVLDREEINRIPVACIVPFINTHRHMGTSVVDAVFDIGRIKTFLLREGLNALALANRPRHYVNENAIGETTIDDLLTSRAGAIVRGRGIPGEAVMPLPTENTFPYAQQGLQHMDTMVEARVGVNRIFQGIDESSMNDYNRIGQLSTMAAQRVEDIARVFGTGFKRLFSIAHELVIKSGHSDETIKLRGQWVEIDPTQWRTGRDMRVTAPFAAGNKDSLLQRLMVLKQIHLEALSGGLPIVDANDAYELSLEIAKAADVQGTKFFTDPSTVEPPPEPPDYTMIALEVEDKKADNEAADEERKAELEKYTSDLSAEIDKYRADLQAQTQLALAQIKAGGTVDLERFKSDLKNAPIELGNDAIAAQGEALAVMNSSFAESIKEVGDAIAEMKADAAAPIKIVREKGKIVGKEVNGQFIPLEDNG